MKSKPPTKKARVDTATTAAAVATDSPKKEASTSKATSAAPVPIPETNLGLVPTFPTMYIPDLVNSKDYARMSQLIATSKENNNQAQPPLLTMEDIDLLQAELECLWSSISLRIRSLKKEQQAVQNCPNSTNVVAVLGEHYDQHHQEKINAVATLFDAGHGTRTSVSAAAKLVMGSQTPPPSPATSLTGGTSSARKPISSKILDKLPKKKLKIDEPNKSKVNKKTPATRTGQNRSHSLSQDDNTLFQQEGPNQFWDFADAYMKEITPEDLEAVEKTIAEHSPLPESLFNIPPLGKHFLKPNDPPPPKSTDVCGPLTQRLVSALVEDRISGYNLANCGASANDQQGNQQGFFMNRPGLVRALGLDGGGLSSGASGPSLESRLRQVLLEQGLLLADDAEDSALANPNDEILADIKNTQATLRKLHLQNEMKLRELHLLAKRELERNAVKRDLEKADKEVLEAYRLISGCRLKKKPLTKKEKDVAAKALEARTAALDKLQDQPIIDSAIN